MTAARLLIVEDEILVARDLEQQLTSLGYRVLGLVARGAEAVAEVERLRPDLVLMDIRLQGEMDGVTAAEAIRQRFLLPVVYLTAHADEATLERARLTEPFGYILKPFDNRELRTVLEMALYKHQAERRLRLSERRYAATLASIGDGVIATDEQGRITFMNPVAETLTGWSAPEAQLLPLVEVFHIVNEYTRMVVDNPVARVLATGTIVGLANSTVLLTRGGSERPIDDCAAPIRGDRGEVTGAVLVFRDVTEKRQSEDDRRELQEQLHQAQKMEAVGQLAAGVAHDFNNLLTIINGNTQLLLTTVPEDHPWRVFLRDVLGAGERAANLVRQLLAYCRKQMLRPSVLDLNQMLISLESTLRRLLGDQIHFTLIQQAEVWPVLADPGQLELVLMNLVVNARDAMPAGGELRIEIANVFLHQEDVRRLPDLRPGNHVRLTVSDTGTGMTEQVKARAFEPFFTTKEVGKGTGLGLASVYGIVKQSGGHILLESELGIGSTFTIYLPVARDRVGSIMPVMVPPGLLRGTETVLLVESEPGVRRLTAQILQMCGYTVLEAGQAQEAVALAERYSGPLHALVTEINVPLLGGRELAAQIRQLRPELKLLFLSGQVEDAVRQACEAETGGRLLQKPFTPTALSQLLHEVLQGPGS